MLPEKDLVRFRHMLDSSTEIEWQQIIGLRNRLIHGYDSIDFDIMWIIICQDIPSLISKLKKILC